MGRYFFAIDPNGAGKPLRCIVASKTAQKLTKCICLFVFFRFVRRRFLVSSFCQCQAPWGPRADLGTQRAPECTIELQYQAHPECSTMGQVRCFTPTHRGIRGATWIIKRRRHITCRWLSLYAVSFAHFTPAGKASLSLCVLLVIFLLICSYHCLVNRWSHLDPSLAPCWAGGYPESPWGALVSRLCPRTLKNTF